MNIRTLSFFFFNDTATTEIYTLSLHDALPIFITMVDECHRSQKGDGKESFAMTMRVKLANGFRYGFTGTPIDRTMQNTHRDFGPLKDGAQERYLSYYGIRRAIRDGATLEVHYIRDRVPFQVDERSEEHTSELQSLAYLVCRLLLEKKKSK